jgi:hypothetical protein
MSSSGEATWEGVILLYWTWPKRYVLSKRSEVAMERKYIQMRCLLMKAMVADRHDINLDATPR